MAAKYGDYDDSKKAGKRRGRGWISELFLYVPELIIWAFKWLFRGIFTLFRNWA